ncbi:MAG: hypothetical protein ACD_54C00646G0006 [uncultured bacterium]|nr:MAG: hypothetical protein ACD_54C00646G0006 [uncultured bacterium]
MGDHRHMVVAQGFLDVQAGGAVKAIAAHRGVFERRAQIVFGGGKAAVGTKGQTNLHKAAACGFAHFRGEEPAFDRQHVDARCIGCGGFLQRGDVEHRDFLASRLHRAHVVDAGAVGFRDHDYTRALLKP